MAIFTGIKEKLRNKNRDNVAEQLQSRGIHTGEFKGRALTIENGAFLRRLYMPNSADWLIIERMAKQLLKSGWRGGSD